MRVRENVELPLKNAGVPKAERDELVDEALEAVGLAARAQVLPVAALRRHAAARGDRPRRGLPARGAADGRAVRRGRRADPRRPRGPDPHVWKKLGVTVLFVTHDIDESVYLGERVIILSSSPTVVQEDLDDRPAGRARPARNPLLPRFTELRHHVYAQIQRAKQGHRPAAAATQAGSAS